MVFPGPDVGAAGMAVEVVVPLHSGDGRLYAAQLPAQQVVATYP
jgi:hypothetical protein